MPAFSKVSETLNSGSYAHAAYTFRTEPSLQPIASILGSFQHYPQQPNYEVNQCLLDLNVKCSPMLVCLKTWSTANCLGRLWNTLGRGAYQADRSLGTDLLMLTAYPA